MLRRVVGTESDAFEMSGEEVTVVDDENGLPVHEVTQAARTVQDRAERPVCDEQRSGADETGSEFGVTGDHGGFHGAAEEENDHEFDDAELRECSSADGAQPDGEECENGER